jgi:hypothetical protein
VSSRVTIWCLALKSGKPGLARAHRHSFTVPFQNDSFPLQLCELEVEDHADFEAGDAQVVQHLPAFVVCDGVDDLGTRDHCPERNQVRDVLSNLNLLV